MTDHGAAGQILRNLLLATTLALTAGCRTGVDDVHRWANTQQGPRKIVAVMSRDKYPHELRVEAAMTLIRMKPRSGRRVGIDELVSGLGNLPAPERAKIVGGMVPILVEEIRRPPPQAAEGQARPVDPTFPYKDAAFALLTSEGQALVESKRQQADLEAALADWVLADFGPRMDESSQAYGMGQLLARLGADGVRRLPQLIAPEAEKVGSIAGFVADFGDEATKMQTSTRLVKVAREVDSAAWLQRKAPVLQKANETSGHKVEGKRFQAQLVQYREEELMRVLSSLKKVGQPPAVDYLLALAQRTDVPEKRRAAALAALEGHVDKKNADHAKRLLDLAGGDATPDVVRDLAMRRVGELPRKQVIESLYALFQHDNWKVRWVAAELALKMSETSHLREFMTKLSSIRHMAITEPIRYGKLIGSMGGKRLTASSVEPYARTAERVPVRLTALGYYLEYGTPADLPLVKRYQDDSARVPGCASGSQQCEWRCEISREGKRVVQAIRDVGEFVRYCVEPAIAKRAPTGNAIAQAETKTAGG